MHIRPTFIRAIALCTLLASQLAHAQPRDPNLYRAIAMQGDEALSRIQSSVPLDIQQSIREQMNAIPLPPISSLELPGFKDDMRSLQLISLHQPR